MEDGKVKQTDEKKSLIYFIRKFVLLNKIRNSDKNQIIALF